MPERKQTVWSQAQDAVRSIQGWAKRNLPPGLRFLIGLLLVVGGAFGFLPILGFWMIPLGLAVAALDVMLFYAGSAVGVRGNQIKSNRPLRLWACSIRQTA